MVMMKKTNENKELLYTKCKLIHIADDGILSMIADIGISRHQRHSLTIMNNISGVIKPKRMTLLLGPPGSGKTTLLLALAGKLDCKVKVVQNSSLN
ncbi:hypothetical protein ACSQ67_009192 [Phaseolus vulgaris]